MVSMASDMTLETAEKSKHMWLCDYLPKEIPGARIFSFGYPFEIGFTPASGKVEGFAPSLLTDLSGTRYSKG